MALDVYTYASCTISHIIGLTEIGSNRFQWRVTDGQWWTSVPMWLLDPLECQFLFFSQSNTLQNISLLMTIVGQTIPSSHSHETMQDRCWNNRLFLCLLLGERQGYLETVRSRLVVSGYWEIISYLHLCICIHSILSVFSLRLTDSSQMVKEWGSHFFFFLMCLPCLSSAQDNCIVITLSIPPPRYMHWHVNTF